MLLRLLTTLPLRQVVTDFADLCVMNQSTACTGLCSLVQHGVAQLSDVGCECLLQHRVHAKLGLLQSHTHSVPAAISAMRLQIAALSQILSLEPTNHWSASIALVFDVCRLR